MGNASRHSNPSRRQVGAERGGRARSAAVGRARLCDCALVCAPAFPCVTRSAMPLLARPNARARAAPVVAEGNGSTIHDFAHASARSLRLLRLAALRAHLEGRGARGKLRLCSNEAAIWG
eukprot:4910477-Pleurochrysis_carterae.AAC.1